MTKEEATKWLKLLKTSPMIYGEYPEAIDMAIEALSADTVSREFYEATIKANHGLAKENIELKEQIESADRPSGEWIPVKWHEITDEEREREGYPKDWVVYIDCEMPCDNQEILVQTKNGYIRWDVCYEDGEFSLDSGWDWVEDILAWMPLPKPYCGADMRGEKNE